MFDSYSSDQASEYELPYDQVENMTREREFSEATNKCWNCNEHCSLYSEYQDDGRTFCSLDCLNEGLEQEEAENRQEKADEIRQGLREDGQNV